jgi:FMN phosphatase YigB (HAD superfamily)
VHPLVILVDVDHTLLDGDAVRAAITAAVEAVAGPEVAALFWERYEAVRTELGGVDVPEAARRVEAERGLAAGALLGAIERADFAGCLCAGALSALAHLATLGLTVVLSDGDARFQRVKIASAGIEAAVEGRVLVVPHKERALDAVMAAFPATHYAMFDDRPGILAAVKSQLGDRVTAIRVRQGRYAAELGDTLAPDLEVAAVAEVTRFDADVLRGGAGASAHA